MNRLMAILLMPLFVVGNSFAHSHGKFTHQSPGESHAHLHVGSAQHHKHSHHDHHGHDHESDESESAPVAPLEHDSDAVYLVAADFVYTACERISIEVETQYFVGTVPCLLKDFRPYSLRDRSSHATTTQLPLYLLQAALRL